jgi:hypothetical protein
MALLVLAGCPQELGSFSSDASLVEVSIAEVKALTLGTPDTEWTTAVQNSGHIYLPNALLENARVAVAKSNENATVFFARSSKDVVPDFVSDTTFTFAPEEFLFIEVFSENLDDFKIYAIQVHTTIPGITDVTLGGRSAVGGQTAAGQPIQQFGKGLGKPADSWDAIAEADEGEIWFGSTEADTSLAVTVSPEIDVTAVRVAVAAPTVTPQFTGAFLGANNGVISAGSVTAVDGNYLYIEAKSDGIFGEMAYYKVKMVMKGSDRSLRSVKFVWYEGEQKKGEQMVGIGPMGTHSFPGAEAYGNYSDGAQLVGGDSSTAVAPTGSIFSIPDYTTGVGTGPIPANYRFAIEVEPRDPALDIAYDYTHNQRDALITFDKAPGINERLVGNYFIALEVSSELGEKGWYKFRLNTGRDDGFLSDIKINGTSIGALPSPNTATTGTTSLVYRVANADDLRRIHVEGVPTANYESMVSYAVAPTASLGLAIQTFDINGSNNFDTFTDFVSGQFIVIRVLPENVTFNPGSMGAYGDWSGTNNKSYYKIQVAYGDADATLSSISVKGNSIGALPTPNPEGTGTTAGDYILANGYEDVTIQAVGTSNKAKIAYAVASANNTSPDDSVYNTDGKFKNLKSSNYIVIRVTSEDGTSINYYKVRLLNGGSSNVTPTGITVNSAPVSAVGAGNNAATGTTVISHSMAKAGFANTAIAVAGLPTASVSYAVAAADNTAPAETDYQTSGTFQNFPIAQWVVIRIVSEDGTATWYYKVRLTANDANAGTGISDIKINNVSITMQDGVTLPAANSAVTGTNDVRYRMGSQDAYVNMTVSVEAGSGSEGATFSFAAGSTQDQSIGAASFSAEGSFASFIPLQWLNIRVISEDGLNTAYYKVRLYTGGTNNFALSGITVNGAPVSPFPLANTATSVADWKGNITWTFGTASVNHTVTSLDRVTVAATGVDPDLKISYKVSETNAATDNPGAATDYVASGTFEEFTRGNYVFIRVDTSDNTETRYYKIRILFGSDQTTIGGINFGTTPTSLNPLANAAATGSSYETYNTDTYFQNVTLTATGVAPGAMVAYGTAATATAAPSNFDITNGVFNNFVSGNYVVIRVTAEDSVNQSFYKVRVITGNPDAELESIKINNNYVIPVPIPNTVATGTYAEILTVSASDLTALTVKVGASAGSNVAFASTATAGANVTSWTNTNGRFSNFTSGHYVVIRVISQNGQTTSYYKVQVQE